MRRFVVAIAVAGMVLGACGGSAGTTTTEGPGPTNPPAQNTTTTTAAAVTTQPAASVEAPELGGTSWNVTDYRLPGGAITNVWKTEVTIGFAADGTVSGSAGCNDYQGTWSVSGSWNEFEPGVPDTEDGQQIALEQLSWTEVACEDAAIMEQEAEILDILQNAGRWVLIDGYLNLRDAEGSFLLEAEPA